MYHINHIHTGTILSNLYTVTDDFYKLLDVLTGIILWTGYYCEREVPNYESSIFTCMINRGDTLGIVINFNSGVIRLSKNRDGFYVEDINSSIFTIQYQYKKSKKRVTIGGLYSYDDKWRVIMLFLLSLSQNKTDILFNVFNKRTKINHREFIRCLESSHLTITESHVYKPS